MCVCSKCHVSYLSMRVRVYKNDDFKTQKRAVIVSASSEKKWLSSHILHLMSEDSLFLVLCLWVSLSH